jgi:hypothetical protein
MKKIRRPVVLTVKYQTLLDRIDELETVAGIRRGLKGAEAGRVMPLDEAVGRIRKRHGL